MKIIHPYKNIEPDKCLKGNLHTHSNKSDGARDPQEVIDDYAKRGYDFLMMSDHDIYTSPEDYKTLDPKDLVLIPGNEVSENGVHLLHVSANSLVAPHSDRQVVIDNINKDGGICIVNHPNWYENFDHCSQEKMRALQNFNGLEIYNGVIGRLKGSPYATNHWDMLLNGGRKVWGYANDDSHRAEYDVGRGWNMVYAQRDSNSITDALRHGRFYASTGVLIRSFEAGEGRIFVETENGERIVAIRDQAVRIGESDTKDLEVKVPDYCKYIRFECWGKGERFAWSQPFFIED